MELCLVKDHIQVVRTCRAFRKTTRYNKFIKEVEAEQDRNLGSSLGSSGEPLESEDETYRTVLMLSDLPVAISSTCNEVNEHSERLSKRVENKMTHAENYGWKDVIVELIMSNEPDNLDNYLWAHGQPTDGIKFDVFDQITDTLGITDNVKYQVKLSLCHLDHRNAKLPENLVVLKGNLSRHLSIRLPAEIPLWFDQNTGYIWSKVSVTVTLDKKTVDLVYGYVDFNQSLLNDADFADVEVHCADWQVVRCHRSILASKSEILRCKFKEMMEQGDKMSGVWGLQLQMGGESAEAFLEYIYCGKVSKGLTSCDVALELLLAAKEYKTLGLEQAMDEIITAKDSSNFEYFSVDGAIKLFLYARNIVGLRHLRNKAVTILKNYLKTKSDLILASNEYQDLFENQQKVAMELSSLYIKLS